MSEERGFPLDEAVPVGLMAGVDKCVVVCSGRWEPGRKTGCLAAVIARTEVVKVWVDRAERERRGRKERAAIVKSSRGGSQGIKIQL